MTKRLVRLCRWAGRGVYLAAYWTVYAILMIMGEGADELWTLFILIGPTVIGWVTSGWPGAVVGVAVSVFLVGGDYLSLWYSRRTAAQRACALRRSLWNSRRQALRRQLGKEETP